MLPSHPAIPVAPKWAPRLLLAMLLSLCAVDLMAQTEELLPINERRLALNRVNMYVLGGWAIGNIAVGGYLRSQTTGTGRYFHEMNAAWNLVNLGLAAAALYGVYTSDPSSYDLWQTLHEQQKLEKILLVNLALNVSYMTAGGYLIERSRRGEARADQFKGYGQSLLLQGGFLLLFDTAQFLLHHYSNHQALKDILTQVQVGPQGVGLMIGF